MAVGSGPADWVAAVAEVGGRAKVRTGGITADLFPSVRDLGRFLEACAAAGVPFKATAGLHHAVRSVHQVTADPHSPAVMMHGFLNLFLAAVVARGRDAPADALESVLGEESPDAFVFDAAGVIVKGRRVASEEIVTARQSFALSFGSCSFDEPTSELKALAVI